MSERTKCAPIGALPEVTARAAPGRPKPRAVTLPGTNRAADREAIAAHAICSRYKSEVGL